VRKASYCKMKIKRYKKPNVYHRTLTIFFVFAALIIAARIIYLDEQGNFHVVTKGHLYRSAQLDNNELASTGLQTMSKKYKVKDYIIERLIMSSFVRNFSSQ